MDEAKKKRRAKLKTMEDVALLSAHLKEQYINEGKGLSKIKRLLEVHGKPGLDASSEQHRSGVHARIGGSTKDLKAHQKKERTKLKVRQLKRKLKNK